ncbi:MAG: class I SAM-dependent methyltransferase [Planctomycetaceae bacterium]|nr:class I SAM-dependent methyltransferase [Planctomycetaceae bacterium]
MLSTKSGIDSFACHDTLVKRLCQVSLLVLLILPTGQGASADEKPRNPVVPSDNVGALATLDAPAEDQSRVPADINKEFLSPDLNPEEWLKRFEIESREVFAGRKSVIRAIGLKKGSAIADVGSGTGLYLGLFSREVGESGRVYAVDISPRLIEHIQRRVKADELNNVRVIQSEEKSARLLPESVDFVFVCDTYHHFEYYPEMLQSIRAGLKPGGQLVLVDFNRIPGVSRDWLLTHVRAGKGTVKDEVVAAGFEFVEEVKIPEFHENYFLRFRRPTASSEE